jgi:hypothetical protein
MDKNRHILAFLWAVLFAATSLCGQQVRGLVRDSSDQAVPYASVVVTDCHDEQVLAFTSSDEQGKYQLAFKTDCDSITLTTRALGYTTGAWRLAARDLPAARDFALGRTVLKEVLIRAKTPPVIVRNDTTEYNVASFSDSTEFSVEDLLKKLPGVQVSENGLISLNGKTVERVLIEGDDLFSQNYAIATRNVRANMVSKVQAIDRYQENPLMKGIQESECLVLNLKIKEEKKRSTSGSVTGGLGYGSEAKGYAHANLFSLTRRDKTFFIGDANNTGQNPLGEVDYLTRGDFFDKNRQNLQSNPLQAHDLIQRLPLESMGLPAAFSRKNQTGVLCIGQVMPFSPFLKLKMSGWVGQENLQQNSGQTNRYLLETEDLVVSEARTVAQRMGTRHLQAELEYYAPDQKQSLRAFARVDGTPLHDRLDLQRSQSASDPFRIAQSVRKNVLDAFFSLEYTRKKGANAAFQAIAKGALRHARHTLSPEYAYYAPFFGLDSTFTHLNQSVRQREEKSLLMTRWIAQKWAANWTLESGAEWETGRLQSDLTLGNSAGERYAPGEDFQNNFRLRAPHYFLRATASREFGALFARLRLGGFYVPLRLLDRDLPSTTTPRGGVEPHLDLRYTFTQWSILSGFFDFQQRMPAFTDYFSQNIFTDYQSVLRGLPLFAFAPSQRAGLRYSLNMPQKHAGWHLGINASQSDNQLGAQHQINPFLFLQERFRPVSTASYSASAGAHRYFSKISSRFELGLSATALQQQNRVNSDATRDIKSQIYSLSGSCGTAFDTWVNVILSAQATHSSTQNTQGQLSGGFGATNWFSTAQINIKPSKRFDAKIYVHQVSNRLRGQSPNRAYAANAECLLRSPAQRSELRFSAFNLFNSRRFEQTVADAFFQTTSSVVAVEPFFLVVWDYSF